MLEGKNPGTIVGAVFNLVGILRKIDGLTLDNISKASKMTQNPIKESTKILLDKKAKFPENLQIWYPKK